MTNINDITTRLRNGDGWVTFHSCQYDWDTHGDIHSDVFDQHYFDVPLDTIMAILHAKSHQDGWDIWHNLRNK